MTITTSDQTFFLIFKVQNLLVDDKILWPRGDNCGNFTVASMYAMLSNHTIERNDIWKRI